MKQSNLIFAGMFLVAVFLTAVAPGQEKKLAKSDLPAAVRKTADDQSKGAAVKGYASEVEDGKTQYEVELMVNGHFKDVTIGVDGSVLEVEEQVAMDALPLAVRKGLQKKAGSGKITKVESITKRDTLVAYEARVMTGGKRSEVQVGPDGKELTHLE